MQSTFNCLLMPYFALTFCKKHKSVYIFNKIFNRHVTFGSMMLIRVLFYFIVFYSLFKMLIKVVLPIAIKSTIRTKMKDMGQSAGRFDDTQATAQPSPNPTPKKESFTPSKGDYIDFEEVK